jgi:twitching motility protein PilT
MEGTKTSINDILKSAVKKDASDIHIHVGASPTFRIHRVLHVQTSLPKITSEDAVEFLKEVASPEMRAKFERDLELDFTYSAANLGRFRVSAYIELGTIGMVFRWVRTDILSFKELGLPSILEELSLKQDGMIILTGPTGCGKSTTLSAMINFMNQRVKRKITTIEDPVEFLYKGDKCLISQREVGPDTHSFADALKHVLRQDPDVILIGEMRDPESIAVALTAAETGHLILATLHTPSSYGAIERIVDAFPPYQQQQVRLQLATTLQAVIYQVLLPKSDTEGSIPAVECLVCTSAIKNLIRENKAFQIQNYMQSGKEIGMQTLERSVMELVQNDKVDIKDVKMMTVLRDLSLK